MEALRSALAAAAILAWVGLAIIGAVTVVGWLF